MFTKHFPFELKTHGSNKQQQQKKMDTLKLYTQRKKNLTIKYCPRIYLT